MTNEHAVVIAGAGPTGLMLAGGAAVGGGGGVVVTVRLSNPISANVLDGVIVMLVTGVVDE